MRAASIGHRNVVHDHRLTWPVEVRIVARRRHRLATGLAGIFNLVLAICVARCSAAAGLGRPQGADGVAARYGGDGPWLARMDRDGPR